MDMISLLPDAVADQIAAGEVLEQPSSAVKELIENALDAGAKTISIEIEAGGLQKIRIEDDGCGMSKNDAALCLKRHATSKIRSADDLQKLSTMGFRGEALAAISAVSSLELQTSNGSEATRIAVEGGINPKIEPCARNRGTTIEIRSLFSNTPARLKFQKSPSACAASVLRTVQTISLAHPEVNFRVASNGKSTFVTQQSDWTKRAEEVLGAFEHTIDYTEGGIEVRGLIGSPSEAKMNRSGQTLFVNKRPISSFLVSKAVKEGFGTRIGEQLHPSFLLFLELPPESIDVNVHPQKREIRFRDEGKLYTVVRSAVVKAFEKEAPAIAPMPWDFTPAPSIPYVLQDAPVSEFQPLPIVEKQKAVALLGDFLLVEERPWKLIDLRGAEARVLYEQMETSTPSKQPLLWSIEYEVEIGESPETIAESLATVGIEARPIGKRKLAIDALPSGMEPEDAAPFIQQFSSGKNERRLAAAITRVCRSSSRKYNFDFACQLMRRLHLCSDKNYDPLGKKIGVPINEDVLAELFQ